MSDLKDIMKTLNIDDRLLRDNGVHIYKTIYMIFVALIGSPTEKIYMTLNSKTCKSYQDVSSYYNRPGLASPMRSVIDKYGEEEFLRILREAAEI